MYVCHHSAGVSDIMFNTLWQSRRVLNRIKKAFYKLRLIQLKCIKEEEMNVPTADEKIQ